MPMSWTAAAKTAPLIAKVVLMLESQDFASVATSSDCKPLLRELSRWIAARLYLASTIVVVMEVVSAKRS